MLRNSYGMDDDIGVLQTFIPFSVKIQEASSEGVSIFRYAPKCKVEESFSSPTKEIMETISLAMSNEKRPTEKNLC